MLHAHHINKFYGGEKILDDISFHVAPREKVGLIGVNGSGKTTLLKIIHGAVEPDGGQVIFSIPSPTALLSQEVNLDSEKTLCEEMRMGLPNITEMEKELRKLENEMAEASDNSELMHSLILKYTKLQEQFEQLQGRDIDWKIDVVIQGLGFTLQDKNRSVAEFSGGWQMRIQLAKLLLQEKEVLLLDEPTNHLDLRAIEWLEDYLHSYPATVVIVSHDRYFLNRVTTKTLYLERGKVRMYTGNYEDFMVQREKERELLEQAYKDQQKKFEKDERFINRFRYKATLASRVKSREKMLDRIEKIEAPEKSLKTVRFSFEEDERGMTTVFRFKELKKEYPGKTVELDGEMEIRGGEKIALMGDNGSGKTTLLRILAGIDGRFRGKLSTHPNAEISIYLQNQAEHLNVNNTALEELRETAPRDISTEALRTILGSFLLQGEDVFKKISVLSGGEKARVALAGMVCSPSNILLFDEPTNHLDFESREVLANALDTFDGTVIVVSHDRYFIEQVCDRIIEISEGKLVNYPGNYSYYKYKKELNEKLKRQIDSENGQVNSKTKDKKAKQNLGAPTQAGRLSPGRLRDGIMKIEETITKLEESMAKTEQELENPDNITDPEKLQKLLDDYSEIKEQLDRKMMEWEDLTEQLMQVS
jgi:ATP-binding cassette, subfamily F, member 3